MALAKLLEHGVTSNDSRLVEVTITVDDDQAYSADAGGAVRTRSQRVQLPVKEISIFVKIIKLLIYELSNCFESTMAFADEEEEEDDSEVGLHFLRRESCVN